MLLRTLPTLLLAATAAHALQNASPFLMFSSEPLAHNALQTKHLATAASIEADLLSTLSHCPESQYVLVAQPGVKAADLRDETAMPKLRRRLAKSGGKGSVVEVAEMIGDLDVRRVARQVEEQCSGASISVPVLITDLSQEGSAEERAEILRVTDKEIDTQLSRLEKQNRPYILVFTSGPSTAPAASTTEDKHLPYEMDEPYPSALHTDLRRDLTQRSQVNGSDNAQQGLPLFEKYQFLTPAIFMGLSVSLLLFAILYVGVSAIAGLEVSYMAFSKEMGPGAQGKGKQQ